MVDLHGLVRREQDHHEGAVARGDGPEATEEAARTPPLPPYDFTGHANRTPLPTVVVGLYAGGDDLARYLDHRGRQVAHDR